MSWNSEIQRRNPMNHSNNPRSSSREMWQTQTEELLVRHTDKQVEELSSTVQELKGVLYLKKDTSH